MQGDDKLRLDKRTNSSSVLSKETEKTLHKEALSCRREHIALVITASHVLEPDGESSWILFVPFQRIYASAMLRELLDVDSMGECVSRTLSSHHSASFHTMAAAPPSASSSSSLFSVVYRYVHPQSAL